MPMSKAGSFFFYTAKQQDVAQLDTVSTYPKLLLLIPITKHCYALLFPCLI